MKKNTKKLICFVLIFALIFQSIMTFLKIADTNTLISMRGLAYEKENDYDVIILGQSDVYTAFIPTEAWKQYKFSSFAYGLAAIPSTMFPSMLNEISKKQRPKLLVVEITAFSKQDDYYERSAETHSWIDNLPLSKNRYETIRTAIPKEKQKEYFQPISTYHNNWKLPRTCARTAFVRFMTTVHRESILKGFSCSAHVPDRKYKPDKKFTFTKKDKKYLNEFIAHCKEMDYDNVLFVRFPHMREIVDQQALSDIETVVTDSGYDFLDLNSTYDLYDIDPNTDFYNCDHLNLYGAEKFTTYFGKYLQEHYNLTPRTDEEFIKRWDENSKKADLILEYGREQMEKNSNKRIYEFSLEAEKLSQIIPLSPSKEDEEVQ